MREGEGRRGVYSWDNRQKKIGKKKREGGGSWEGEGVWGKVKGGRETCQQSQWPRDREMERDKGRGRERERCLSLTLLQIPK